jgi:hypothetical protein
MTNEELVERLNSFLKEVNEMLALGDLGLLKSEELHGTKHKIEDALNSYKDQFGKIEALKIEKAIPMWRNTPKTGMFLNAGQVNPELEPLHILLQELITAKGGSEQISSVTVPELKITGSTINQAINDARTLLETQGATSAVDRVHTVLHGYLKQVCNDAGFPYSKDATLNELMKILKDNHPALSSRDEHTEQILNSMANVLHHLNPIRNNASLAHANPELLKTEEAVFVINTVNTLLSYLNSKF